MASLMTVEDFDKFLTVFQPPIVVTRDDDAGTVLVNDGVGTILSAILKDDITWIVLYFNTTRTKWGNVSREELLDDASKIEEHRTRSE